MYSLLADGLVFLHLLYISYVVLGQVVIVVAGTFHWAWGRNPWFRLTHLAAILIVAVETVAGYECPLTTWERDLRAVAGEAIDERGFVARMVHDIVFLGDRYENPESIAVGFIAFFLLVMQGFLMYPPRLRREQPPAALPLPQPQPTG